MSLRYLVPSLGLLACTAGLASAADVGANLSLKGYVDTTLAIESLGDDLVVAGSRAGVHKNLAADGSNTVVDFRAGAQIEVGYKIGDVTANIELYYADTEAAADLRVEQAYVNYAINNQASVKMGRQNNGLGLEGYDAPELYRVNNSVLFESGVIGGTGTASSMFIDGVTATFKATDQFSVMVGVADGIYEPEGTKDNGSLALIGQVKFVQDKVVSVKGTLAYDMDAGLDDTPEETGAFGIDVVAITEKDFIKDLIVGGEIAYLDQGEASIMGIMGMANYKLPTPTQMSVTGMVSYVSYDDGEETASEMEIAGALLINPTKDDNFATNIEARFISRDLEDILPAADDADEFGIFFEMVAVIP